MTTKLCVFVSSVQKELEDERLIVQNLMNTDGFLSAYCTPVLYKLEPRTSNACGYPRSGSWSPQRWRRDLMNVKRGL